MAPARIYRSVVTGLLIDAGLGDLATEKDIDLVLTVRGDEVTLTVAPKPEKLQKKG